MAALNFSQEDVVRSNIKFVEQELDGLSDQVNIIDDGELLEVLMTTSRCLLKAGLALLNSPNQV